MKTDETALLDPLPAGPTLRTIQLPDMPPEEGDMFEGFAATLDVLLLHEDLPTDLRARQVIDRLRTAMELRVNIVVNPWRLETLSDPLLREMALDDAQKAAIVFLSLHGHRQMPPVLSLWLDAWLRGREMGPGALVLSLDAELEGSVMAARALDYVRATTASSIVMVFPHFGDAPPVAKGWMFQNGKWPAAMAAPFA